MFGIDPQPFWAIAWKSVLTAWKWMFGKSKKPCLVANSLLLKLSMPSMAFHDFNKNARNKRAFLYSLFCEVYKSRDKSKRKRAVLPMFSAACHDNSALGVIVHFS